MTIVAWGLPLLTAWLLLLCPSAVHGSCSDPILRNGFVQYERNKIRYSCRDGHTLTPDYRVENFCYNDEYWSFAHPTCDKVKCGYPPALDTAGCYGDDHWCRGSQGRYTGKQYSFDDEVPVICKPGFGVNGTPVTALQLRCQEDGSWSHANIVCEIIKCSIPSAKHGRKPIVTHLFDPGWTEDYYLEYDEITVRCPDDTTMAGQQSEVSLVCMEGGEWDSSIPRCNADCSTELEHGEWQCRRRYGYGYGSCRPNTRRFIHGERRRAQCDTNYEHRRNGFYDQGDEYSCTDGNTTDTAECTPKRCPPCEGCTITQMSDHSTRLDVSCKQGYKAKDQTAQCDHGVWKPSKPCSKYCNLQVLRENGLQFFTSNVDFIWKGDSLDISCDAGSDLFKKGRSDNDYVGTKPASTECEGGDTWSTHFKCFTACNTTLEHGEWMCRREYGYGSCRPNTRRFIHGETRRAECDDKYENRRNGFYDGSNEYSCTDGDTTDTAECTPKRCSSCEGCEITRKSDHLTRLDVSCKWGYKAKYQTTLCRYGVWEPSEPCSKYCNLQRLRDNSLQFSMDNVDFIWKGDKLNISCDADSDLFEKTSWDNYVQTAETSTECEGDDTWSTDFKCFKRCPLPYIENGDNTNQGDTVHGGKLQYRCQPGYTPRHPSGVKCRNGDFADTPACDEAPCTSATPCKGCDLRQDVQSGRLWRVKCLSNYRIVIETSSCDRGTFMQEELCTDKCARPDLEHGTISDAQSFPVQPDVSLQYQCSEGYEKSSGDSLCRNGYFYPRPTCLKVPCSVCEGCERNTQLPDGDNWPVQCSTGYSNTTGTAKCTDSQWDPPTPCKQSCPVSGIKNSNSSGVDFIFLDEEIVIGCDENTKLLHNGTLRVKKTFRCKNRDGVVKLRPAMDKYDCYKSCLLEPIEGGEWLSTDERIHHTERGTYNCSGRSQAITNTSVMCDDGKLDPPPTCAQEEASCARIESARYFVDGELWTGCEVPTSDNVTVECIRGFGGRSENFSISCGQDGRWNETFECQPRACNCPTEPRDEDCQVVTSNNGTIFPFCAEQQKNIRSRCVDGTWEPSVCSDVSIVRCGCDPPPHAQVYVNNTLWSPVSELVPVGDVNVTCTETGTREVTTSSVRCLKTGRWSQQLDCVSTAACRLPQKAAITYRINGEIVAADTEVQHGVSVSYSYATDHNVTTICEEGKWTTDIPDIYSPCVLPAAPERAVYFQLIPGYRLASWGRLDYRCQLLDGRKSGWISSYCKYGMMSPPPHCPSSCRLPKKTGMTYSINGVRVAADTDVEDGHSVSYSCAYGHSVTTICKDGKWTTDIHACYSSCEVPAEPELASAYNARPGSYLVHSRQLAYKCKQANGLSGQTKFSRCRHGIISPHPHCSGCHANDPSTIYSRNRRDWFSSIILNDRNGFYWKCRYAEETSRWVYCQNGSWSKKPSICPSQQHL